MAWDVRFEKGVWLPQLGWWLDGQKSAPRGFVSHAHSDHLARHREVLCTPATARFMQLRLGGRRRVVALPYGARHDLAPDCTAELHPAGHILGSAQLLATTADGRLLYTGDFRLGGGRTAGPCATPRANVLIMETTFGLPRYVLPPAEEVGAGIVDFCRQAFADGATPVLYAYALGKTQELVALLGAAGLPLMLHPQAWTLTRLYPSLGCPLPPCREFSRSGHRGHVVIAPAGSQLVDWIHPRRTAAITGWALDSSTRYRYGADAAFPLSDHSDYRELLAFVERVQPDRVYTLHGFAREFAATLRRRGVEAWAIGQGNQLELSL